MSLKSVLAGSTLAALVGLASPVVAQDDADLAAGERVFAKCRACHTLEEGGRHKVGPNLWGFIGREAAAAEGFKRYSKAMKEAGIVWDTEILDAYLVNPRKYVPGTNMAFVGVRNDDQRRQLILYLEKSTTAAP